MAERRFCLHCKQWVTVTRRLRRRDLTFGDLAGAATFGWMWVLLTGIDRESVAVCNECQGQFRPGPSPATRRVAWVLFLILVCGTVFGITSMATGGPTTLSWLAAGAAGLLVIGITVLDQSAAKRRLDRALEREQKQEMEKVRSSSE